MGKKKTENMEKYYKEYYKKNKERKNKWIIKN